MVFRVTNKYEWKATKSKSSTNKAEFAAKKRNRTTHVCTLPIEVASCLMVPSTSPTRSQTQATMPTLSKQSVPQMHVKKDK